MVTKSSTKVVIDPDALVQYDVTIQEVIERVRANNLNVGAQFIEKDAEEYVVRSVGWHPRSRISGGS